MTGLRVEIRPADWLPQGSRWDKAGPFYDDNPVTSEGATHTHAWAANRGCYAYGFQWPAVEANAIQVAARLSSEHPWYSSPPNHFSDVTLVVNDHAYPSIRVIPDNGSGMVYRWALNAEHLCSGANILRLAVPRKAPYGNGLCVYHKAVVPGYEDCPIVLSARY